MDELLQTFVSRLFGPCGVNHGDRLLLAVSGGCDSLALLYLCCELRQVQNLDLCVAHLNHRLRSESTAEAEIVARHVKRLGLPLISGEAEVAEVAKQEGGGIEETARRLRYRFLRQSAVEYHCHKILLGHHRGDQAETVLHRLVRGAGPDGLAGMAWSRGDLARPLLDIPRSQLENYLQNKGIDWCEDASNADLCFSRNRLRHRVLPELARINPQVEKQLADQAWRMARDADFWRQAVAAELAGCCEEREGVQVVHLQPFGLLHPALQIRLLLALLERLRGKRTGLSASHLESLCQLALAKRPQAELDLPGCWAGRRYQELWLARQAPQSQAPYQISITGPGHYPLPGGGSISFTPGEGQDAVNDPCRVWLAAERLRFPLLARSVLPGDRFRPHGMSGRKRLQDFLVDQKVSREVRAEVPLLVADEIIWVAGFRVADGWLAEAGEKAWEVVYKPPGKWSFRL